MLAYRDVLNGVNPILHYIAHAASFSSFSGQNAIDLGHVCCGQVLAEKFHIIVTIFVL